MTVLLQRRREHRAFGAHSETASFRHGAKVSPTKMKKLRNKLRAATYVGTKGRDMRVLFQRLDKDHSGTLSRRELAHGLKKLVPLTDQEMGMVWHAVDQDNSGEINIEEFIHFVAGTKNFRASAYGGKDPFGHITNMAAGTPVERKSPRRRQQQPTSPALRKLRRSVNQNTSLKKTHF